MGQGLGPGGAGVSPAHSSGYWDGSSHGGQNGWDPHQQIRKLMAGLQAESEKLTLLEAIGQGGFGTVYKGGWAWGYCLMGAQCCCLMEGSVLLFGRGFACAAG